MNLIHSRLSTTRLFVRGGRAGLVSVAERRGGSQAHWIPLLLALIAVLLAGCVSRGGIVQHSNPVKQPPRKYDGPPRGTLPGHDTEASPRLVRLAGPDGSFNSMLAQPGDYVLLDKIPYRYQGEPELTWEPLDHVVRVNGREAGLDLSGLDVKTAVALVIRHPTIQTVLYHDADAVPEPLVDALAATSGRRLALSLCEYHGASKALAYLASKLASKIIYLSLEDADVGNDAMAHLSRLSELRGLGLSRTRVSDAGLVHLSGLTQLRKLNLTDTHVSDVGLARLSRLTQLRGLGLSWTRVSDAGLAHLSGMRKLRMLDLRRTQVSDAGLARLSGMRKLRRLGLSATKVGDAGLVHLSGLPQLRKLELGGTQVTDAGATRFEVGHPFCTVLW